MPTFEKLSKDEVEEILEAKRRGRGKSQRERILEKYVEQLEGLAVGEGMAIRLEESDNRQTVKNRIRRAASRLGYEIEFIRSRGVIRIYRVS
ncbi:MAG: hypothetical protein D6775_08290 [Caldilineae bacterium]|nr:MAG: hypothetical protein D6775_08290 [Caldilineae bacterium]